MDEREERQVLTPEEIQSREFLVSLRGYDRDEVHAFLDEVAEAFAELRAQVGGAADAAPAPPEQADTAPVAATPPAAAADAAPAASPFAAIAAETQRILEAAAAAGEELRRQAQAEADAARRSLLADAEQEIASLREQAAATQHQVDVILRRRDELAERLRQARDTVDLAILELDEDEVRDAPADPRTSVLAEVAADEPDDAAVADVASGPAGDDAGDEGAAAEAVLFEDDDDAAPAADAPEGDAPEGDALEGDAPEGDAPEGDAGGSGRARRRS
jgi:DivIVA domain-containing protein